MSEATLFNVTVGDLLTFTADATNADGAVTYRLLSYGTEIPAGAVIDSATGVFTFTPIPTQAGTHSIIIQAIDLIGSNPKEAYSEQNIVIEVVGLDDFDAPLPIRDRNQSGGAYSGGLTVI